MTSAPDRVFTPGVIRRLAQLAGIILLQAVALFGSAGTLAWSAAWVYMAVYVGGIVANGVIMLPRHTALIEARGRIAPEHGWDAVFMAVYSVAGIGLLVVAGLDERFGWTAPLPVVARIAGGLLVLLGYALFVWAMYSNAYFQAVSRAQPERGQTVARGGPYRWVRHPGYAGLVAYSLACPCLLGSAWAFIPALALVMSIVARTYLEDRMLRSSLQGYADYAAAVRFRLIPGLW